MVSPNHFYMPPSKLNISSSMYLDGSQSVENKVLSSTSAAF